MGLRVGRSGDLVDGPRFGVDDVSEGVAIDGDGPGDHTDEEGGGAEVGDAGKRGEVGSAIGSAGANEADGLGSRESGGELDAGELFEGVEV